MKIEVGKEYKIYYAGKSRWVKVTNILKDRYGNVTIAWKYHHGFPFGWSAEWIEHLDEFKDKMGREITSVEI